VAPECSAGSQIRVALDTGGAIDEVSEANNTVSRPCPVP
jgi:hypothetical protein